MKKSTDRLELLGLIQEAKTVLTHFFERRYIRQYNVSVKTFPGNIIAGWVGYKAASEYFKADEKAKIVPEVKF